MRVRALFALLAIAACEPMEGAEPRVPSRAGAAPPAEDSGADPSNTPGATLTDGPNAATPASAGGYAGEQRVGDWLKTGVGAPDYAVAADGDGVRIDSVRASRRWVALVQVVAADAYAGRRVTVSFDVKTEGTSGGSCVVKVQRTPKLQSQGYLASGLVSAPSLSSGYSRCDISIDVAPDAAWMLYGFTYRGSGRAWVRDGRIEYAAVPQPAPQPAPVAPGRMM